MDINKCWFVRTQEGVVEGEPMTQQEALLLGEFLIANKFKGHSLQRTAIQTLNEVW